MLDPRRLRVLLAVAREGSFSAAARALDYTQPAVSHHIQRLETEVGTPLLIRSTGGVQLTEAGDALVQHAEAIALRLQVAEDELAAFANLHSGRVRVVAFPSASATLIPSAARQLRERHPGLSISLTEAEPPEAIALLRAGGAEIAIVFDYPESRLPAGPALTSVPLLEDKIELVLPTSAKASATQPLSELASSVWIAGCERCRSHLLQLAAEAGFEPKIAFATDDTLTVLALVAAGLGAALLPSLALAGIDRPGVSVTPLTPSSQRRIFALLPSTPRRAPAVVALLHALDCAAAQLAMRLAAQAPAGSVIRSKTITAARAGNDQLASPAGSST